MREQVDALRHTYGELHADLADLPKAVIPTSLEEQASRLFELRDLERFAEAIAKDAARASATIKKLMALRWSRESVTGETIRCPEGTATPSVKTGSSPPSKDKNPEAYAAMLTELGIPEAIQATEVVRIHWPGWVNYLTELTRQGLPLPDCVEDDSTYQVFDVALRSKPKA